MRSLISLVSLTLLAPAALADDHPAAPAPELPAQCRASARLAGSLVQGIALPSKLALAQCLVPPALAPIKALLDTQDSINQLETAVKPALALYDDVIAGGEPAQQVAAASAKAALYTDLLGRMANTVPPPTAGGEALYQSRKQLLDVVLQPWRDQVIAASEQVVAIGKAHPALDHQPATRDALAQAAQRIAAKPAPPPPAVATDPTPTAAASPAAAPATAQ